MSLHYLVKYECRKTGDNLNYALRLMINLKIASTAKHLSCDGLLHYKFIIHCAGENFFKIGEQLAKLQVKWLIVSYTPFALDCSLLPNAL